MISFERLKELHNDKRYQTYFDVGLFFVLIFSFHVIYTFWNEQLHYWPVKGCVDRLFVWASALLFDQSTWVLDHVFNVDFYTKGQSIAFLNCENWYSHVSVAPECTSLKQWMHWLFLMLIFPGPWKHKAWYIPLGLVIIEFINVVRVVGISLFLIHFPHSFEFAHDYIFKTMFYVFIFLMWVIWVECFLHGKGESKKS